MTGVEREEKRSDGLEEERKPARGENEAGGEVEGSKEV